MKRKGFVITTDLLVVVVFMIVGFFIFLLIYSSLVNDSPTLTNTFLNRLVDWLFGLLG